VLAQIALEEGRVDAAEASAREGLELISRLGLGENAASAAVGTAAACLAARSGDVSRARVHLDQARSLLPRVAAAPWLSIRTRALLGRVALTLGDLQLAGSLLGEARRGLAGYLDAGVLPRLLVRQERALEEARGGGGVLDQPLTAAERRVLELLATHLSPAEIGEALHISRNTVKGHLKAIYRKLEVSGRSDAVERARRLGLLDPSG
jgi:LuxR family maltose regulon positive regulatory protein